MTTAKAISATDTTNVMLTGVGGQGIITLSAVFADACLMAGLDVKKSEVHGMSQRGGSVESHVRFSSASVFSPLIPAGEADIVVALERLEALRASEWCRPGGKILMDDRKIVPVTVTSGPAKYPEDCLQQIRALDAQVTVIGAFSIAEELGEPRAANMVMLGAVSEILELPEEAYTGAMSKKLKSKALPVNTEAFGRGRALMHESLSG